MRAPSRGNCALIQTVSFFCYPAPCLCRRNRQKIRSFSVSVPRACNNERCVTSQTVSPVKRKLGHDPFPVNNEIAPAISRRRKCPAKHAPSWKRRAASILVLIPIQGTREVSSRLSQIWSRAEGYHRVFVSRRRGNMLAALPLVSHRTLKSVDAEREWTRWDPLG